MGKPSFNSVFIQPKFINNYVQFLCPGGHFVVYMTPYPPQYIEGVEFFKMGQQGTPQRYPLNFHILGASPGTFARKNAIHQSRQVGIMQTIIISSTPTHYFSLQFFVSDFLYSFTQSVSSWIPLLSRDALSTVLLTTSWSTQMLLSTQVVIALC